MAEAIQKGATLMCTEAMRHVHLFLATHKLIAGDPKAEVPVSHRNDKHWRKAHTQQYHDLCAEHKRLLAKHSVRTKASAITTPTVLDKVLQKVCPVPPQKPVNPSSPDRRLKEIATERAST
eukprot:CAMPEP_0174369276 /NCGR_PEP_ID=MMETSP0811_2-20130205/91889_1 /TAXON_ID=73025 ORGANISM="Eutreptiella gymnastica-like, Strain CCMP1594" /NCGR_SAMPLE_ID=MMETSP0811_2 /ASSEMBLY_ACC=CAM_ASM_000667 /LENGTH=120 /DNA_ID=CAMNT_0015513535 /DNA_START=27 /DNA_END=385 /DNA_ORIENTATION=-